MHEATGPGCLEELNPLSSGQAVAQEDAGAYLPQTFIVWWLEKQIETANSMS